MLDTTFCVDCLQKALQRYVNPEIFNNDQGCQFNSDRFTGELKAHGIAISMDGRGPALDNTIVERLWRQGQIRIRLLEGLQQLDGTDNRADGILCVLQ